MSKLLHLAEIIITLQYKGFATASELSDVLGVEKKTIYRYIETLIAAKIPVETRKGRNGGFYLDGNFHMKEPDLTAKELQALILASEILSKEKGFHYEHYLKSAVTKIKNVSGMALDTDFRLDSIQGIEIMENKISKILQAVENGRSIEIGLFSLNKDSLKEVLVDPYTVVFKAAEWYVIGFDHDYNEIRSFILQRIAGIKLTNFVFIKPADFLLQEFINIPSNVFNGNKIRVIIKFDKSNADFISGCQLHSSQEIEIIEDGSIILKMYLDELSDLKRWILSFGTAAEVVEPLQLRNEIRDEVTGVKALYDEGA